jgi:hypothetical protein
MGRLFKTAFAASLCLAALAWPAGARADTVVSADTTASNVSAYGGALVWSRMEAPGVHRLVQRVGGVTSDVPVPPLAVPFDADIGPAVGGGRLVVYSRCTDPANAKGCDVYQHVLGSGAEQKARLASTRRCSETAPSTWEGSLAFARSGPRCKRGLYARFAGKRKLRRMDRVAPVETEIRRNTIVTRCRTTRIGEGDGTRNCVRYRAQTRGPYTVDSATLNSAGEGGLDASPSIDGGFVYWIGDDNLGGGANVLRAALRSPFAPFYASRYWSSGVQSISVDGGTVYYVSGGVFAADAPAPSFTPP